MTTHESASKPMSSRTILSISTQLGQIELQVILSFAFSRATTLVEPIKPCFAAT